MEKKWKTRFIKSKSVNKKLEKNMFHQNQNVSIIPYAYVFPPNLDPILGFISGL